MDRRRAPAAVGSAVFMRWAGAAIPASQASARVAARAIPAALAPAPRHARDVGLALRWQEPLRGRGGHPILRSARSFDDT